LRQIQNINPTIMNETLTSLIRLQELTLKGESKNHISELHREINRLRAGLSQHILRRFDHFTKFRRLAVAQLSESGACNSCHMRLLPADALHIRSSSHRLATCPFCECFLYSPPPPNLIREPNLSKREHD